jgi:hypothetical protein
MMQLPPASAEAAGSVGYIEGVVGQFEFLPYNIFMASKGGGHKMLTKLLNPKPKHP